MSANISLTFCARIATATLLLATIGAPAVADDRTKKADDAARIVEPLREIGRVKAHTTFCIAFVAGAGPAVNTALGFEIVLQQTLADARAVNFGNELAKQRSLSRLEYHLNELADLATAGRAELQRVRDLANMSDDATHDALMAFADAIDGAKGHQMLEARKLSSIYGRLAEHPVYSLATTPADDLSGGFRREAEPKGDWLLTDEDVERYERGQALFNASGDDQRVGADLLRAGEAGRDTLALNAC